ncbi:MAG: hypothetical protein EON58_09215, partial [Alphaproteobacteria bacterium]
MTFGFQHTRNIKLAGGYIWDEESSRLRIDEYDEARFSSSSGPWGSHLGDEWMDTLNRQIGGLAWSWSSLASLIASGRHPDSPIAERQRYCHQLLSEAYCEPHDHIRLVRMVSALEAIAVLDGPEKASALAWNCAQAGGFSNFEKALDIEAAVFNAYKVRNRIVHGDGASDEEIGGAFRGLEQHILDIVA